jgi:hypothetical protein
MKKHQTPNTKHQRSIKLQSSKGAIGDEAVRLGFCAWCLFGIWSLELGVYPRA